MLHTVFISRFSNPVGLSSDQTHSRCLGAHVAMAFPLDGAALRAAGQTGRVGVLYKWLTALLLLVHSLRLMAFLDVVSAMPWELLTQSLVRVGMV